MDDDASNRFVLRNVLSVEFEVLEASTSAEALAVCERQRVDLIVADVVMPIATGPEVAKRLLAVRPSVAVLFVSGYPFETLTSRGVLVPGEFIGAAVGFLQKPFTARALLARAREILFPRTVRGQSGKESSANSSAP